MTKEYRDSRKAFWPEAGGVYENEGGGIFRCLKLSSWNGTAQMQNVRSGWTFDAHGVGIYKDGLIEWDYSTGGFFAEMGA